MTVFEGIRLGISFAILDIWIIWLTVIIADMIFTRKQYKKDSNKINEVSALLTAFRDYQKATDEKYRQIIDTLNSKEEE